MAEWRMQPVQSIAAVTDFCVVAPETMEICDSKFIITLFGKKTHFKEDIGVMILKEDHLHHPVNPFVKKTDDVSLGENETFKVVCTGDIFEEDCLHPDQQIIDCMALSHPGPHLFILAIDAEHTEEDQIKDQTDKLKDHFGKRFTSNLVVLLRSIEDLQALTHLEKQPNIKFATASENLSSICKKWCSYREQFPYDYTNYSRDVVERRRRSLNKQSSYSDACWINERPSYRGTTAGSQHISPASHQQSFAPPANTETHQHIGNGASAVPGSQHISPASHQRSFAAPANTETHQHIGNGASGVPGEIFNIILLGLTGTGKSASGNTILAAGKSKSHHPKELFKSEAHSVPVTRQCEAIKAKKLKGAQVMVVDTPDFFSDLIEDPERHIEECKRYLVSGRYAVLLVIQVGRFTDGERGILEKLEKKLDCKIRHHTTVLLTHAEDLKDDPRAYIDNEVHLKHIVEMCSYRFHLFKNNSKEPQQVKELVEKIPFLKQIIWEKHRGEFNNKMAPQCCLS